MKGLGLLGVYKYVDVLSIVKILGILDFEEKKDKC